VIDGFGQCEELLSRGVDKICQFFIFLTFFIYVFFSELFLLSIIYASCMMLETNASELKKYLSLSHIAEPATPLL
jgi:hypothetical protein